MRLVDTHCHVHLRAYDGRRNEVIRRAREAGVFMITVGTNAETSQAAQMLAAREDGVWASVGLHPNHLFPYPHDPDEEETGGVEVFDAVAYRELARRTKVVAIGECGLDFYRIPETLDELAVRAKQEEVFRLHLDLADEVGLPVIIHCRDAHDRVQHILSEYISAGKLTRRGVIHCFTGTVAEAQRYLPLGFFISFTGIITFPPRKGQTETLADVVRTVPLDRILVETDAPYLAPMPFRGKQNEPAYVRHVAEAIAIMKGVSLHTVAETTTENARTLFRLW